MQELKAPHARFSFLHSKSYYIVLLIAAIGVQTDYALTIQGLTYGFQETRPLYWLHFIALFVLISMIFVIMYKIDKQVAIYSSLVIAVLLPLLPIVSNLLVLRLGGSPFI